MFFSERKIIDIRLSKPIDERTLAQYQVNSFNGIAASLELDLTKNDLQSEIAEIFRHLPVHDINVNNIPIEQVIKEIYSRKVV